MKKPELLYLKVKDEIMRKIEEGVYPFEEKLPSEAELAKELNVGRSTVREAVKFLQKEHVLTSRNGVGTYVNRKSEMISNSMNQLKSLGKMIRDAGYLESEADVRTYRMSPEPEWAEKLNTGDPVFVLERTRTANGRKVAFYYNILPEKLVDNQIGENFTGSLLDFMEKNMKVKIAYALTEICAVDESEARDRAALEILGSGVLLLKQLHFDEAGTPVLYSIDYLKSSVFKLTVKREL